jgi:hypothetical protein
MEKPTTYIETSVVSYLTSRPSRDLIVAGHQQVTPDWWEDRRADFEVYASAIVLREAAAGNPRAAQERLALQATLTILEMSAEATALAEHLVKGYAFPQKAAEDALHLETPGERFHPETDRNSLW